MILRQGLVPVETRPLMRLGSLFCLSQLWTCTALLINVTVSVYIYTGSIRKTETRKMVLVPFKCFSEGYRDWLQTLQSGVIYSSFVYWISRISLILVGRERYYLKELSCLQQVSNAFVMQEFSIYSSDHLYHKRAHLLQHLPLLLDWTSNWGYYFAWPKLRKQWKLHKWLL